ncbi:hypothetical protein T492DRAFT_1032822 [Pavlovales sp. CCMP2436]|nr:hypothetical protein T492DRAFT_1032822 [Pavlovales sp. CCMP2436]
MSFTHGCGVGMGCVNAAAALELLRLSRLAAGAQPGAQPSEQPEELGFCGLLRNLTSPAFRRVVLHLAPFALC